MDIFKSVLLCLLVTILLYLNLLSSPVFWETMGHGSESLPSYRCLGNRSYTIILKIQSSPGHSTYYTTSWSHHIVNLIDPRILSAPVHSSYMGRQDTCSTIVACLLWMYYLIGQNPVVSSVFPTGGYSHSPPIVRWSAFPEIL